VANDQIQRQLKCVTPVLYLKGICTLTLSPKYVCDILLPIQEVEII